MHGSEPFWTALWELLGDGPHWAFEVITDVLFDVLLLGLLFPLAKRWVRRHDEEHHHGHTTEDSTVEPTETRRYLLPQDGVRLDPVKGMEWQGLRYVGSTHLVEQDEYDRYTVRINEDGTFVVAPT